MKKRTFLTPIAALLTALTAEQTSASVISNSQNEPTKNADHNLVVPMNQLEKKEGLLTLKNGEDTSKFILIKNENEKILAWHSSHASHASHASHSSHYSGRY